MKHVSKLALAAAIALPAITVPAMPRGIVSGIRAEGPPPDATALIEALNLGFEEFKAANDERLAGIDNKFADVVQTEKVARIDASIGEMQAAMDEINVKIAAAISGVASENEANPAMVEYKAAFNKFFRKGIEGNLQELAVKAALQTDSDPDGGYTVPDTMESGIDRILLTVSAMRALARVVQISTAEYVKLHNVGGTASGWVGEREARAETDTSVLKRLTFTAMELYANPAATQAMLDDSSINIEQWIADEVAIKFAEDEGAAFVTGTGFNQPRGILSYTNVVDASYAWGNIGYVATGVAADINDGTDNGVDALIRMAYALKGGYRAGATWLMNRTLVSKVRILKTIGDDAQYLWQPSIQLGQPATLLGYPVIDDDNMPDVGANAFPIAFANFARSYLIVDRTGIRVLRDPFTNKPYVMFYTTKRVGGGIQNFESIKLLKCEA